MTPFRVPPALEVPTFLVDAAAAASRRSAAVEVAVAFDAEDYLARHPHVIDLIGKGEFADAEEHWLTFGEREGTIGSYVLQPNAEFTAYCLQMDAPRTPAAGLVVVAHLAEAGDPLLESLLLQSERSFQLMLAAEAARRAEVEEALAAHGLSDRLLAVFEPADLVDVVRVHAERRPSDWFVFLDPDVQLVPDAVRQVGRLPDDLTEGADAIYFDEGVVDLAGRRLSFRKPEWSPTYFLASAYACGFVLFAAPFLSRALAGPRSSAPLPFALLLSALRGAADIRHSSQVVSWSGHARLAPADDATRAILVQAVSEVLTELAPALVQRSPADRLYAPRLFREPSGAVSVVIPTADRDSRVDGETFNLLDRCIETISRHDPDVPKQFVIVHNGDMPAERRLRLSAAGHKLVLFEPEDFNFSQKVNIGVRAATHETLLILNDDVQATADWLAECCAWLELPGVAAVGPKLLYPDHTLQHAGCGLFKGIPYHPFHRAARAGRGVHAGQADTVREMASVTAACLLTTRTAFDSVGGFDEELFDLYNDADFCLRLREAGGRVLYSGRHELLHLESVSLEPSRVHGRQLDLFRAKWGSDWRLDPYYNPEISRWTPYRWDGSAVATVPNWSERGGRPPPPTT